MTAFDLKNKENLIETKEQVFDVHSFEQLFEIILSNKDKDSILINPSAKNIFSENQEFKDLEEHFHHFFYVNFLFILTSKYFLKFDEIWTNHERTETYRIRWRGYYLWVVYDEDGKPIFGTVENSYSYTKPYYSECARKYANYKWRRVKF